MPGQTTRKARTEQPDIFFYEELCHDLKAPMSILFAYLQLLERMNCMPTQATRYLQEAKKNCFRMAKLVWDANDGMRISKGLMLPRFVNGDMVALVREICHHACVLTDPKHIQLIFESRIPAVNMAVDRQIMERILLNLLSNAKKYSHEGGVIQVSLWEKENEIYISVRDYGPGIPEDMASRLFTRHAGGASGGVHSGLGLYIVSELVALLGGDVYLTPVSPGTEMQVRLPIFFTDETADDIPVDDFFNDNMIQMELSF